MRTVIECCAAIEHELRTRAALNPVEFAMPAKPSGSASSAWFVLERVKGRWGIYLVETKIVTGERTHVHLGDATLTVMAAFLEESEMFVAGALEAMDKAAESAGPAIRAGDRAIALLLKQAEMERDKQGRS